MSILSLCVVKAGEQTACLQGLTATRFERNNQLSDGEKITRQEGASLAVLDGPL